MSTPILEVNKLVKDYDTFRAVDGISFSVEKGQVMGLLGPNGAGKSTTIQMLIGVTLPTSGKISYFGKDFYQYPQQSLQRINFASAYNTLQGRLTVKENLTVFAGLYCVKNPTHKIAELIEYFEANDLIKHKYWDLSAGERTRVNLIKALLNDPELILMDEPTASLDPDIADKTLSLIEDLRASRELSILFTSHNMQEVTRICDQVIFLDKGKIVSQDTPTNHIERIKDVEVILRYVGQQDELNRLLIKHKIDHKFESAKVVHITTTNSEVSQVIARVADSGFRILDTEVNKPTLEDVFLQIARREK